MSNRADPSKVRTVYLDEWRADPDHNVPESMTEEELRSGPACLCEPGHHLRDNAVAVLQLGYGAKAIIHQATQRSGVDAGILATILQGIRSWNLVLDDGSPRPFDSSEVQLLDDVTVQWLFDSLAPALQADPPLPNAPSAPSPDGPSGSAGPIPTSPSPTDTSPGSTST